MSKTIISAQNKAIVSLKKAINSFVKSRKIKTRVIPLAIPTGWGKTRIALQGILRATYLSSNPPSIIIWPQKHSHIEQIWKRETEWRKKVDKTVRGYHKGTFRSPIIKFIHSSKPGPKAIRHDGKSIDYPCFPGTFYSVNNNFKKGIVNQLDRNNGPIIFIIDEWHTKKIIEKYEKSGTRDPESFWRNFLIGKQSTRKLFIILISATPIGATSQMDSIPGQEDQEEDTYEEEINNALRLFNKLTSVGNQSRKYNLYKIYPELIKREERKLRDNNAKHIFRCKVHKNDWAKEYIRLSKKCYSNNPQMIYPPSLVYSLESLQHSGMTYDLAKSNFTSLEEYFSSGYYNQHETLKLKIIRELINKYSSKKFVIFCRYIVVARSLYNYLSKNGISCCYLQGDVVGSNKVNFNEFNNDGSKIRILIVTDEHSQGISLHKSKAWLIHFELSWNPIRIVQRYGRVWRIDQKTKKLTSPVAFYIPHLFSSEEEQIARLKRRWQILSQLPKEKETFVDLAPISFEVSLGIRCTPSP